MTFTEINIQPKTFVTTHTSNKIMVVVSNIQLFQKADIYVQFLDNSGIIVDQKTLTMEGDEYLSWTNNDQYVIDWAMQKLGLSLNSTTSEN